MPPLILIDALYRIAKAFGQWHDDAELLSRFITAVIGEDVLQRSPSEVCRLLNSRGVKSALAERGVLLTVSNGFITLIHAEVNSNVQ